MSSRPLESLTLVLLAVGQSVGAAVILVRVIGGILRSIVAALASLP